MYQLDSSYSSDRLICVKSSILGELEVQGIPLEVIVVLNVNVTVDNWLGNVEEEKHWDAWEHNTSKVTGDTYVQHSVSFISSECIPPSV